MQRLGVEASSRWSSLGVGVGKNWISGGCVKLNTWAFASHVHEEDRSPVDGTDVLSLQGLNKSATLEKLCNSSLGGPSVRVAHRIFEGGFGQHGWPGGDCDCGVNLHLHGHKCACCGRAFYSRSD